MIRQFNLRCEEDVFNRLEKIAKAKREKTGKNIYLTDLIKKALEEFLSKEESYYDL